MEVSLFLVSIICYLILAFMTKSQLKQKPVQIRNQSSKNNKCR